jgi:hypothetical protein
MEQVLLTILGLVAIKSVFVGSAFSFPKWFKYGKEYTEWYFNQPEFKPKEGAK